MDKKTLKKIDKLTANIIKLILLLSSLIGEILLHYFAFTDTYGLGKTIFITLLLFIFPIVIISFVSKMENKKERHFVLCSVKIVWSIILSIFYINFFVTSIPMSITIPLFAVTETLSNLLFIFNFNKTNNLIANIKTIFITVALSLMTFFMIDIKLWFILVLITFLPTLIIHFGASKN